MRHLPIALVAAGLLAGAASFQAQSQGMAGPYVPPNDQADCTDWTRKLEAGIAVIAAPASAIASAQKSLDNAKQQQAAGKFQACAAAASSGIRALDAG
jgi:hypothetical protein